jgi:hypothetical protein
VPARTGDVLGADDTPHRAAGVGDDLGQFLQARPTAYHGERTTAELFHSDVIFHANHASGLTGKLNGGAAAGVNYLDKA